LYKSVLGPTASRAALHFRQQLVEMILCVGPTPLSQVPKRIKLDPQVLLNDHGAVQGLDSILKTFGEFELVPWSEDDPSELLVLLSADADVDGIQAAFDEMAQEGATAQQELKNVSKLPTLQPGNSLAVYVADVAGCSRKRVVDAIFKAGVPAFGYTIADVKSVLLELGVRVTSE